MLDHSYFLPQMEYLAQDYQLIFYDQRLAGRSSPVADTSTVTLDTFVDDIEEIRKHFDLGKINLMGHSWGGLLSFLYAIRYPENLGNLILVGSTSASSDLKVREDSILVSRFTVEEMQKRGEIMSGPNFREGKSVAFEQLFRLTFTKLFFDASLADQLTLTLPDDFFTRNQSFNAIGNPLASYDYFDQLTQVSCPALIFCGDNDPSSNVSAAVFAEAIPNSTLIIARNCGHFPFIECPEEFKKALEQFLN